MSGLRRTIASLGAAIWLVAAIAAGQAHAQGDARTIEVVPAEGASGQPQSQTLTPPPAHPANIGNPQPQKGPEQRVALVIGNSAYTNATPLANPANDAKQIAQLLTSAGFDVTSGTDLDHDEMIQVLQDFAGKIAQRGPNTVAFVYYAGHGLQLAGDNFLVPVDAKISSDFDVDNAAIRLVDVMATLEAVPSRMRIVVLDACRNNPFDSLKDAGRGLAIVDAPNGSIVGYSTAPGAEAFDGSGRNSPYTAAFLRLARQPNVPIEQFFKRVRVLVNDTTDGRQTPWESSSLTGDFYFFGETATAAAKTVSAPAKPAYAPSQIRSRPAREAYEIVLAEDSVEYYEEFVRYYPHDPMWARIRALLDARLLSIAWYRAVLANSSGGYQSFYSQYSNSPYAQMALKLKAQPKPQPLYQPTHIIVPPQLVPNVKLTALPVPPQKLQILQTPTLSPQIGTGKQPPEVAKLPPGGLQQLQPSVLPRPSTPPPGKSLLDVKLPPQPVKPAIVDGKIKTLPGVRPSDLQTPGGVTGPGPGRVDTVNRNPDVRIVPLPNGGTLKIGPKVDRVVDLPPNRVVDHPGKIAPQFQGLGRPNVQGNVNPSVRFQPGMRIQGNIQGNNERLANVGARGGPPVQFRGPRTQPAAKDGRPCAIINGHPVCR